VRRRGDAAGPPGAPGVASAVAQAYLERGCLFYETPSWRMQPGSWLRMQGLHLSPALGPAVGPAVGPAGEASLGLAVGPALGPAVGPTVGLAGASNGVATQRRPQAQPGAVSGPLAAERGHQRGVPGQPLAAAGVLGFGLHRQPRGSREGGKLAASFHQPVCCARAQESLPPAVHVLLSWCFGAPRGAASRCLGSSSLHASSELGASLELPHCFTSQSPRVRPVLLGCKSQGSCLKLMASWMRSSLASVLCRVSSGFPHIPAGIYSAGDRGGSVSPLCGEPLPQGSKAHLKLPVFRSSAANAGAPNRANLRVLREVLPNGQQRLLWGEIGPGLATIKAFLATPRQQAAPSPPRPCRPSPPASSRPPSPVLAPRAATTPRQPGPPVTAVISVESVLAAKGTPQDSPSRPQHAPAPRPGRCLRAGEGHLQGPASPHLRTPGRRRRCTGGGGVHHRAPQLQQDGAGQQRGGRCRRATGQLRGAAGREGQEGGVPSGPEGGPKRARGEGAQPGTLEEALKHAAMATNKGAPLPLGASGFRYLAPCPARRSWGRGWAQQAPAALRFLPQALAPAPPRAAEGHAAPHAHSPATYLRSTPPTAAPSVQLGHRPPAGMQAPFMLSPGKPHMSRKPRKPHCPCMVPVLVVSKELHTAVLTGVVLRSAQGGGTRGTRGAPRGLWCSVLPQRKLEAGSSFVPPSLCLLQDGGEQAAAAATAAPHCCGVSAATRPWRTGHLARCSPGVPPHGLAGPTGPASGSGSREQQRGGPLSLATALCW